jgi:ATP-dependent helicase Lhr and Lhr-like helicase
VASCATHDWLEDDLFNMVIQAFHYRTLSRERFDSIIEMLSNGIAGSRGRYGAYLFRDRVNHLVKARRGSRLTAITCGGAIPENGLFTVITEPNGITIGTLDEDFAVESNRGDIILLGSTSWRVNRVESGKGRVLVEDAHGAPPNVPFWRGEAPERTKALSWHVSELRQKISDQLPSECDATMPSKDQLSTAQALVWLQDHCKLDPGAAEQLVDYILKGRAILGAVPTQHRIIAERFFDESGGMQLILHAPFGARINKAWGLALRKAFCRSFNLELQASATDNGINIALTEQHSFPLVDVFQFLKPSTIKEKLIQAVLQSPLFTTRWRWNATRALALVRFRNGKKVPPNLMRMRSEDLLAAVFPDAAACQDNLSGCDIELPEHPLIDETIKDCLSEALDLAGLSAILTQIQTREITCIAIDTPMPSLFAHEILNANPYAFLDDAPLEERRARAVEMRRLLPQTLLNEIGALDANAISEVQQQAWPDVRDADELHDVLQTMIVYPTAYPAPHAATRWTSYLDALISAGRAGTATVGNRLMWFAVEKAKMVELLYPQVVFHQTLSSFDEPILEQEESVLRLLQGWLPFIGPVTSHHLSQAFELELKTVDQALLRLEGTGLILRGSFKTKEAEWCERRLLARIHRLTLGKLRKAIEPVCAAEFVRWLLTWQHVTPGTQLNGEQGLLAIIKQLQGFEAPAKVWERGILSKRVKDYQPAMLDLLCMRGQIGWGRLSSSIVAQNNMSEEVLQSKSITPTSISPITFFIRDACQWMPGQSHDPSLQVPRGLSDLAQRLYDFLEKHGASFFSDIAHEVHALNCEIERGLWELITAGVATADSFDNLRALIDPRRRLGTYKRRQGQLQYSTSRWSLLKTSKESDISRHLEAVCWMLLTRYGVVFRDLLAREKGIPRWRELLMTFRRLEDRGEVRGGHFVDGFLGEQFALPFAVDSLRAIKKQNASEEVVTISASDPLNVVGFILPGDRVPAMSGKKVRFKNGMVYTEEEGRD